MRCLQQLLLLAATVLPRCYHGAASAARLTHEHVLLPWRQLLQGGDAVFKPIAHVCLFKGA